MICYYAISKQFSFHLKQLSSSKRHLPTSPAHPILRDARARHGAVEYPDAVRL